MTRKMITALTMFCALLLSTQAARAGDQDFTLVNKTGVAIHQVLVSPHDSDHWGTDIMGKDTLDNGEHVEIKFAHNEDAEDWDLKVMDKEGHAITWLKLRLTKISKIVLHFDGEHATAELE